MQLSGTRSGRGAHASYPKEMIGVQQSAPMHSKIWSNLHLLHEATSTCNRLYMANSICRVPQKLNATLACGTDCAGVTKAISPVHVQA